MKCQLWLALIKLNCNYCRCYSRASSYQVKSRVSMHPLDEDSYLQVPICETFNEMWMFYHQPWMLNKFMFFCITNENDCIYTCLYIFLKNMSPPCRNTDGMRSIVEMFVNTAQDSLLSRLHLEDSRHSSEPARSLHDSVSHVAYWQLFSNQLSGAGQAASLPIDVSMLPLLYEEDVLLTAIPTIIPILQVVLGLDSRNLGIN